ncbi:MAG TPA: biotin/lipoyl-containing protein [Thermoanaerobaculia bacterium]|nr:biotin/lipoyl-containing protein [Thermoanaerobaculia bacterium]
MKKLRITVNGKVYDVEVQVLQDDEAIGSPASLPYPGAATLPIPEAARPASLPAPVPGGAGDPNVIASPLAGTVQKVFVTKGMPVEAKTPLVLLDAMKMDTYIYAPRTGTIAEVCVEVGAAVQVRDPLIRYAPEG